MKFNNEGEVLVEGESNSFVQFKSAFRKLTDDILGFNPPKKSHPVIKAITKTPAPDPVVEPEPEPKLEPEPKATVEQAPKSPAPVLEAKKPRKMESAYDTTLNRRNRRRGRRGTMLSGNDDTLGA